MIIQDMMLEESIRKDQISRNGILARLEKEKLWSFA